MKNMIAKSELLSAYPWINYWTSDVSWGKCLLDDLGDFLSCIKYKNSDKFFSWVQVHKDWIAIIDQKIYLDAKLSTRIPETDGLITDQEDVCLLVSWADCMPVFLYDPQNHVIWLVHAGWKWISNKIVLKTLDRMQENFNTDISQCIVYVWPSIHSCCYPVKHQDQVQAFSSYTHSIVSRDDKLFIDLGIILRQDLLAYWVKNDNIEFSDICTCCNKNFASHHREWDKRNTSNLSFFSLV